MDDELQHTVDDVATALGARGWQLVTAESCTGGLIASSCVAAAGSSGWFAGGVVSYSAALKQRLLGVPAALIAEHGVVSAAVAQAMVNGVLARSAADLGVAVTGVAGPGGGSPAAPVGTVWLAWAVHPRHGASNPVTARYRLAGDRQAVREAAASHALRGVLAQLI